MLRYQLAHDDDVIGRLEAVELLSQRSTERLAAAAVANAARGDGAFWAVREAAASALKKFASASDSVAATALLVASADSDARVRESAATSLAAFSGERVEARLRDLARSDSSLFVRGAALGAYAQLDPSSAFVVIRETLTRFLARHQRTSGVRSLEFVDTPEAWNMLLPYLAFTTDRHTRQAAIATLTAKAMKDGRQPDAAAAIAPVLDAPDFYSRASAAQALGALGQETSLCRRLKARLKVEAESRVINAIDAAAKEYGSANFRRTVCRASTTPRQMKISIEYCTL